MQEIINSISPSVPSTGSPTESPTITQRRRPKPSQRNSSVPAHRRKAAGELETELALLQEKYEDDELSEILQTAIMAARALVERTTTKDRETVFKALERWDSLTMEDLLEETQLSRWIIQSYLNEFAEKGVVIITTQPVSHGMRGKPRLIYSMSHKGAL